MPDSQTWKILATPNQRFALARLFVYHPKELTFKGKQRRAALARFSQALGLEAPIATLNSGKNGAVPHATDRTPAVFEVTAENADFLSECLDQVDLSASELAGMQGVVTQLDTKTASGNVDEVPVFNPDGEDWSVSTKPVLDGAERYVEVDEECLRRSESFETYKKLKLAEYAPAKSPTEKAGRLASGPAQA